MDHVRRRTRFRNTTRGYTGMGYNKIGRSPIGYAFRVRDDMDDWGLWPGDELLNLECNEGSTSGRGGKDVRFGVDCVLLLRIWSSSKPQSLVTSHQNEYSELTRHANSLFYKNKNKMRISQATLCSHTII
jgi:hypothetical protein